MKKIHIVIVVLGIFIFYITYNIKAQNTYPFQYLQTQGYFETYCTLDSLKDSYDTCKYRNEYWQALGTAYSFLGKYEFAQKAFAYRDSLMKKSNDNKTVINISSTTTNQDSINNLYSKYDIVLLNEAHHISKHRAFVYNQLPYFKQLGFKYLAIEALNNGTWEDSLLQNRGYPIYTKTGIYINDPVFAHVIRRAIELDFELISYESYNKNREREQALNIAQKYDSSIGKLIVYAGYAHICESPERSLMGYHLKNILNKDILTISQYIPVQYEFECTESISLITSEDNCYDYHIIVKENNSKNNLPSWYNLMEFKTINLNSLYPFDYSSSMLIQLFYSDEKNGIPVYQYLIDGSEKGDIEIAYPKKGKYKLIYQSKNIKDTMIINL